MPRVEAVRHNKGREDRDVVRQFVVQSARQRIRWQGTADVEMRNLRQGVHSCVGSTRSVKLEIVPASDQSDGSVDLSLDCPRVCLNLPPAVACAGVLDGEFESGQDGQECIARASSLGEPPGYKTGYKKGGSAGYAERNGAKASSLGVAPHAIRVDSGPLDVMS